MRCIDFTSKRTSRSGRSRSPTAHRRGGDSPRPAPRNARWSPVRCAATAKRAEREAGLGVAAAWIWTLDPGTPAYAGWRARSRARRSTTTAAHAQARSPPPGGAQQRITTTDHLDSTSREFARPRRAALSASSIMCATVRGRLDQPAPPPAAFPASPPSRKHGGAATLHGDARGSAARRRRTRSRRRARPACGRAPAARRRRCRWRSRDRTGNRWRPRAAARRGATRRRDRSRHRRPLRTTDDGRT